MRLVFSLLSQNFESRHKHDRQRRWVPRGRPPHASPPAPYLHFLPPSLQPTNHRLRFRRRSLLGGYKAHSEAVQACRPRSTDVLTSCETHEPAADNRTMMATPDEDEPHEDNNNNSDSSSARKRSRTQNNPGKPRRRRLSESPKESERMPGAELAGGRTGQNGGPTGGLSTGIGGGSVGGDCRSGGLARCQRLWKMVPQAKDNRPTWLRQYEVCGMYHMIQNVPCQVDSSPQCKY